MFYAALIEPHQADFPNLLLSLIISMSYDFIRQNKGGKLRTLKLP
jgi:hypothetical protein